MAGTKGYRRGTRKLFSRNFRERGTEALSTYMYTYKRGQFVDIKVNGAFHKGMPHKVYHGHTGKVFDVAPRSIGVEVNKRVKGRILAKRIHVRVEHIHPSKCNKDFLERRKLRLERQAKNKADKTPYQSVKRKPVVPRGAHFVSKKMPVEDVIPMKFQKIY